ncbi:MAG: hypothetical protein ACOYMN_07395 [Roseimicrobium sp.]
MIRVLLGALLGAAACLLWSAISWEALDWHRTATLSFTNEAAVAKVVAANAKKHGLYVLPTIPAMKSGARTEAIAAEKKARTETQEGPFVYAVVRPGPQELSHAARVALTYARSLVACFIVGLLLLQTARLDYVQKVGFCVLCGLFAGLVTDVPSLIWFEAPFRLTFINVADHVCEWFLAGLVISGFVECKSGFE